MNFLDLMENRCTTKKYTSQKSISNSEIEQLKKIIQLSPSSINSQPWRFTFVSDKETKQELAAASYFNAPKVLDSSHVVVFSVLDDVSVFEEQIEKNLSAGAVGYYNQFLKPKGEFEIKSWMSHQVYLSLGIFLGGCAAMGLDSTSMEGIESEKYNSILGLANCKALFTVAIGYRDDEDGNQPIDTPKTRLPMDEIITSIE
jgi:nitroreductase/dihydropteridine reductase